MHRDIKPSNIIFAGGVPKLADIGLVAAASEARSFVGTEGFIPPEGPGTPQADIYSLGIALYVMSTGKSHRDFPEPPADLVSRPDHGRWLELQAIIYRACQADLRQRYTSAGAMLDEIELLDRGQSVVRRHARQRALAVLRNAGLTAAVLALLAYGVWLAKTQSAGSAFFEKTRPSTNDAANALCQMGLQIVRADEYGRFGQAVTNLEEAIQIDPNFALPYVGLLEFRLRDRTSRVSQRWNELDSVLQHLEKLAPELAATHCARALDRFQAMDYVQARIEAKRAIRIDPDYVFAHTLYGWLLSTLGSPRQAREELERAQKLNPANMAIRFYLANAYYAERKYPEALKAHREVADFDPSFGNDWQGLSDTYLAMGDFTNSITCLEKDMVLNGPESEAYSVWVNESCDSLRDAFAREGPRGYWEEMWRRAEQNQKASRYWKAVYQMNLGHKQAALDLLKQSLRIRRQPGGWAAEESLQCLLFHHFWDPLREDPEFIALLKETSLSEVMPRKEFQNPFFHIPPIRYLKEWIRTR